MSRLGITRNSRYFKSGKGNAAGLKLGGPLRTVRSGRANGVDVAVFVGRVPIFVRLAGLEANGFLADKAEDVPGFRMTKDFVQRRHIVGCTNNKRSPENAQVPGESRRTSVLRSVKERRWNRRKKRIKNRFGDFCSSINATVQPLHNS